MAMAMAMEDLSEEERRALRGSKFAPLPPPHPASSSSSSSFSRFHQPRLAHPGGPLKTNKAAALAKFLERKLHQDPHALSSINPRILDLAVRNAKASLVSTSATNIRHVDSFDDDPQVSLDEEEPPMNNSNPKKLKNKKKNKKKKDKHKRQKIVEESDSGVRKKLRKKTT